MMSAIDHVIYGDSDIGSLPAASDRAGLDTSTIN
jgi:hypothetical protein